MEDIYLDKPLDVNNIGKNLSKIFPALVFFEFDFIGEKPKDLDLENPDHIIFNSTFHKDKKEFGFNISVYKTPEENNEERQFLIGKSFADEFNIRVLVPFTNPESPNDPTYDIIFENGKIYLADDSDTSFADNSEGLVKIIREYDLPKFEFDSVGNLIEK